MFMDIRLQLSMLFWISMWISMWIFLDFYGYPCIDLLWILDPGMRTEFSFVVRCWNGDGVGVSVARSVSDALDSQSKYSSLRRGNGFLRRPEVLETVYSVEEDSENTGANQNQGASAEEAPQPAETPTPAKDSTPPPISRHGPRHHSTPEVPRGKLTMKTYRHRLVSTSHTIFGINVRKCVNQ